MLRTASKPLSKLPLEQLPEPSHCGRITMAKRGNLSLVAVSTEMKEFWAELRGGALCVFTDDGPRKQRSRVFDVTFCWKAQPPPPASGWTCSPELVTAHEGLIDGHTLVVYTTRGIFSCRCQTADDLINWEQARVHWAILSARKHVARRPPHAARHIERRSRRAVHRRS